MQLSDNQARLGFLKVLHKSENSTCFPSVPKMPSKCLDVSGYQDGRVPQGASIHVRGNNRKDQNGLQVEEDLRQKAKCAAVWGILKEAMDKVRERSRSGATRKWEALNRATKLVKRPKSYIFTVKQRIDEPLKDYVTRFNKEALCINGCNDDLMLSAMMAGLKPSKLLWSLRIKDP
ncbi:hypothetical protein FNV43_RR27235 [Rhamnella rubrinervis]|uniref:Retrotransposon gag domain-containing protein n=1 Tax=Rhamnella rubrinervis TaxID=2594499 RepID=A0A8K0DRF6_9ROSA|nr:hypothetical protein FNV43_RR27235 [Rhamnella rubrinervis]